MQGQKYKNGVEIVSLIDNLKNKIVYSIVLGTLVVLRPTMVVWINFMPMPMWLAGIFWGLQDLIGVFIADNVGNIAHLGGLACGLIFGLEPCL